jgi:hypothetical protein
MVLLNRELPAGGSVSQAHEQMKGFVAVVVPPSADLSGGVFVH